MVFIRTMLLAVSFFVLQAPAVRAAEVGPLPPAAEEVVQPKTLGERFDLLKYAMAPWFVVYSGFLNSLEVSPEVVPTMAMLKRMSEEYSDYSALHLNRASMIKDLIKNHDRLVAAGLVLEYECCFSPSVPSSGYVRYKKKVVMKKIQDVDSDGSASDGSEARIKVRDQDVALLRLIGLPENLQDRYPSVPVIQRLMQWHISYLTEEVIGKRVTHIIDEDAWTVELSDKENARLRTLLTEEYKNYVQVVKNAAKELQEYIYAEIKRAGSPS